MRFFLSIFLLSLLIACSTTKQNITDPVYHDPHRPQIHFSPKSGWMNDPNGMVFHDGTYHLFYQHYPDSTIWGPMHWGHATSTDLLHWQEQPIALYPDDLGMIFSGSAVVDKNNTTGFGKDALVAIYTYHNDKEEKTGSNTFQTQGIAYSTNNGKTWKKYDGNPVLKNPGIRDFRDPKVMWHEASQKWIMTLAAMDHISFYSSPDLKSWVHESDFGKDVGAHGGVWECPDLFTLNYDEKDVWFLIVNINPGGPNGGSATQYFSGSFDGKTFTPTDTKIRWLDFGPDEYAGITWSNTGDRRIFLGWMSNWQYANQVPTARWRSATTVPRELGLEKIDNEFFLTQQPVPELTEIRYDTFATTTVSTPTYDITAHTGRLGKAAALKITSLRIRDFEIVLSNSKNEEVLIGYSKEKNEYYIDRTKSGSTTFQENFAGKHVAPRISPKPIMDLKLIFDVSSVELFADDGLTTMSEIYFPTEPFTNLSIRTQSGFVVNKLEFAHLKSIW